MIEDYKNTPLWNNDLPLEERLDYLIKEMTLEEKIQCLTILLLSILFTCFFTILLNINLKNIVKIMAAKNMFNISIS